MKNSKDYHYRKIINLKANHLKNYIIDNPELQGKYSKFNLANAFVDMVEKRYKEEPYYIYKMCLRFSKTKNIYAPIGSNEEYIPFCGTWGLGIIGKIDSDKRNECINIIKQRSFDKRWRVRDAAAKGIQEIMLADKPGMIKKINNWLKEKNLELTLFSAECLASPELLKDKNFGDEAINILRKIIPFIHDISNDDSTIQGRMIIKRLSYAIGIVVSGYPVKGFIFLNELANTKDTLIIKTARQSISYGNLKSIDEKKSNAIRKLIKEQLKRD